MKRIAELDEILKSHKMANAVDGNLLIVYRNSVMYGTDELDLNYPIPVDDIAGFVNACRKYGIEIFTFSSEYSGAIDRIKAFIDNGCELKGVTEVIEHKYSEYDRNYMVEVPVKRNGFVIQL